MADRTTFLERIRTATARGRAHRASVNPLATHRDAWVGGGVDLVATLLREWIAVGGSGERLRGDDAARQWIGEFLDRNAVRSALLWQHPLLKRLEIDSILEEHQVDMYPWDEVETARSEAPMRAAFSARLGITSVDWAIAETGTLALCSRPGQGRVVSLLPPVYLAIVEPTQIVPDLFDLFETLEAIKFDLPSNLTLVTGPSKTGDIELKLTTGVHGPGAVHLVVVEN